MNKAILSRMRRFHGSCIMWAVPLLLCGCALYVSRRTEDVTHDPKFQGSYRVGQIFKLKVNGFLMKRNDDKPELWSPTMLTLFSNPQNNYAAQFIRSAVIPAGSLVHIERLEHEYSVIFPPLPGDTEYLNTYGSLVTPSNKWEDILILPDYSKPGVMLREPTVRIYPPDTTFLEELSAPSTNKE